MRRARVASLASSALLAVLVHAEARAQDPFAADVRATPWLSPEDERRTFELPPGFVVTCFAHEPDLFKPMNMAFDARGRLWCTNSTEYPYPVKADKNFTGRDRITILEDTDGDGVADKTTVFADGLDIPIGIVPTVDGCIAFSIPNLWRFRDGDGDDQVDAREVLYGPMGWERDTHGLNNSFRRGPDGWVYANHGYNNRTTVKGRDGHEIHMESGNSYRFRIDGSRIEQFTHGQVNPFGSAFSPMGDLYTADCHTLPITVLLRGACYESFGKPHDGLGFAPMIMHHLHGSTALCGLAYEENGWPDEFRDNLFVGNVMTCRVHRDQLVFDGSTPRAVEQHDFVVTSDPWFRPVDLQFGPDGALYVADFYNRIIGHYEVPLDHPGRDRTSGRIWRIACVGEPLATEIRNGTAKLPKTPPAPNLRKAKAEELVELLAHPQQAVRIRALDELTDRIGKDAIPWLRRGARTSSDANARALSVWGLFRLDALDDATLASAAGDSNALVRVHACRVLSEVGPWSQAQSDLVSKALADPDPFVHRAIADALSTHPDVDLAGELLSFVSGAPKGDLFLRHVALIALRNELENAATLESQRRLFGFLDDPKLTESLKARFIRKIDAIAHACMGVRSEAAGRFLLDRLASEKASASSDRAEIAAQLGHAADVIGPAELDRLASIACSRFAGDAAFQLELIRTVQAGLDRRALAPPAAVSEWAGTLIDAALAPADVLAPAWRDAPVPGNGKSANPWMLETRHCDDGVDATLLSSLPKGETLTGTLRSPPFAAPARLVFYCCGHNGEPDRPPQPLNCVRLRDAATNALLAQFLPPRNDVATRVEIDLAAQSGKPLVLELVDGSPYDAYAWLAVGRFEPPLLTLPTKPPGERSAEIVAAAQLAAKYRPEQLAPRLAQILQSPTAEPAVRAACAAALVAIRPDPEAESLAALLDDPDMPPELIEPTCAALAARDAAAVRTLALRALEIAPSRMHAAVAAALARTPAGASALLEGVARGKAPPALLTRSPLKDALVAALPADGAARIAALTKGLPPEDEARQKQINDRRRSYARLGGDATTGAAVYTKNCAACHRFAGAGAVVGPQLDGIASRGFERIFEDVLAPNRNVDVQFVRTNYFLKNGDVVSALFRREEGATIVVADEQGKETALLSSDVAEQRPSRFSLMPDGLGEVLGETELRDLVAYLMAAR